MARPSSPRRGRSPASIPRLHLRARLAVALLAAAALLPAVSVGVQLVAVGLPRQASEPVGAFEQRLAPVRAALAGTPRVGYVAAPSDDADRAAARFYLTRYALAPVLVVDGATEAVVIADGLRDASRLPAAYRVERDLGGGLLLLRRAEAAGAAAPERP